MEVRSILTLSCCLVVTTGCSKIKTAETTYPKVISECEGQAISGRHIARWSDGHVSLIHGSSRESVIKEFVEPNLDQLERVEPDYRVTIKPQSSGALPSTTLVDNWGVARSSADEAWTLGYRGGGITVAVVDTGMDVEHYQLRNQIAYNKGESGSDALGRDKSTNGIDDDGNGFVDDYAGYDFAGNQPRVFDYDAHGTHVSGIIAAEHQDDVAGPSDHVQGVAPEAKLLPLAFIDASGGGSLYDAMRAIDYAVKRGARVINASWGGAGCSTVLRDQIGGLFQSDVIFVAAAGNSGLDVDSFAEYPASFNLRSQITIGATGTFNSRAQFSNYGDRAVHLFAPGVEILSTVPGGRYGLMSGTSMATPLVSGAVAVLLSARPNASIDQIRQSLYASVHYDSTYRNASRGRLDLGSAVRELIK